MVANLWKNVGGHHLRKHKRHLGEIMGLHRVCADHSGIHHGSTKLISLHKYYQKMLQLNIIKIIWSTQELGNVAGPKVKYLIIHPSLVVPFIYFDYSVVEHSNLWKDNLLLWSGHEGYIPTLCLKQSKESSEVALQALNIDLLLIHYHSCLEVLLLKSFWSKEWHRPGFVVSTCLIWTLRKALL